MTLLPARFEGPTLPYSHGSKLFPFPMGRTVIRLCREILTDLIEAETLWLVVWQFIARPAARKNVGI